MSRSTTFITATLFVAFLTVCWLIWPEEEADISSVEVLTTQVKIPVIAKTMEVPASNATDPTLSVSQQREAELLAERLAESKRFIAAFTARQIKRDQLRGSRVESRYESPSDLVALRNEARAQGTADVRYETLDLEAKDRIKDGLRAKVLGASAVDTHSLVHDAEMIGATKEDFGDSLPQLMVLGAAWLDDNERRMRVNLQFGCPLDAWRSIFSIQRVANFLGLTHSEDFDELVKSAKSRTSAEGESEAQANDRHQKARDTNGCLLG